MHNHLWQIKSSRYLTIFFLAIHLLAISAVFTAQLAIYWQLPISIFLILNFCYCYKHFIQQSSANAIIKCWQNGENWFLQTANNQLYEAYLLGDSVVSSLLLILNFRVKNRGSRMTLLIAADSLSPVQFRQLKVNLLCHRGLLAKKHFTSL